MLTYIFGKDIDMDDSYLGFEIRELMILMQRRIEAANKQNLANLHGMQIWTLLYLFEHKDEEIFQRDIEDQFSIRRPTATHLLQRLEELEYIQRVPVDYDARLKRIMLTDKADAVYQKMLQAKINLQETMELNISDDEKQQFITTLRKIKDNLR
ncbi:MarR family winged helix-turn-helix transcriptional regulator [Periweissella cryptocerci]|nr:MarR family transcriptional regulator [Periweissella cryptocerci]